jgi:hypothetical protein
LLTLATPQLSEVEGVPRLTPVAVQPVFVVAFTVAGQVIVGFILSVTVTVWLHWLILPIPSATVQVTVELPTGYDDGALFVTLATHTLSLPVAEPRFTPVAVQPEFVVAFTVAGHVIFGCVTSTM